MEKYILEIKQKLDKKSLEYEMEIIIKEAVANLRNRFYSDNQIRELFRVCLLKEQTNAQMIVNNQRYLELLNQILNS